MRRGSRGLRELWPLVSVAVLVTYNSWMWWRPLNGNASILNGFLSELAASNQPNALFFRLGDAVTAVIVGVVGVQALRV